ncbi:hypothetical protein KBY27_06665 [Ruegeria pomeroyi]|uniref:Uncharacterized protein n=1 Tax=Ruegeria pomeroyi TaxID=89184 RepID=A0A9Q3ZLL1_9RHOB|nr:hypothetical protein [Ruegeria pomeroyi]MCE8537133.1 hypothetical protein [Ruegeria pomeroyi]
MMRLALILAMLAPPVLAQPVMSAEEFDRYTQGKTLFYGFDGIAYGVERYMSGRRVIWSFLDGECKEGVWYEQAGQICFVYEDRSDPQCWVFRDTGGGLVAQFEGDPTQTELYEADEIGEEMLCYGPDVGV